MQALRRQAATDGEPFGAGDGAQQRAWTLEHATQADGWGEQSTSAHDLSQAWTCGERMHPSIQQIVTPVGSKDSFQQTATTQRAHCGQQGHQQCRTYVCCGNTGHVKADCKQKHLDCKSCGKMGHLATVCRSGGGGGTVRPKTYAEVVRVAHVWKCIDLACKQWMRSEKSNACTACGKARPKAEKSGGEQAVVKDLIKLPKDAAETLERLTMAEDEEMMEAHPRPAAASEAHLERKHLTQIWEHRVELRSRLQQQRRSSTDCRNLHATSARHSQTKLGYVPRSCR